MTILKKPARILTEFLRARLPDYNNHYTTEQDTLTGIQNQTIFTLSPQTGHLIRAILTVTVDSEEQAKYAEYNINLRDKQVILKQPVNKGQTVSIQYYSSKSGKEWIYPDFPIKTLSTGNYPRISVTTINQTSDRNGCFDSSVTNNIHFQIDVWTKNNKIVLDEQSLSKNELVEEIAFNIQKELIETIIELYPRLYDYKGLAFGSMPFEEATQKYRHKQEFVLSGVNVGI